MRHFPTGLRQIEMITLFGVTLHFAGVNIVQAHEGPPFPILMDRPVADYSVSVWADPDIGDAQFFIIIESPETSDTEQPHVAMWYQPVDGRLKTTTVLATRQPLRNQMQFLAIPHFDQRDVWSIGFTFESPDGQSGELTTTIESTPPGYGLWDLVIYLFPFVLLAGMWIVALIRRRRMRTLPANRTLSDPAAHCQQQHL